MKALTILTLGFLLPIIATAQDVIGADGKIRVALVKMSYTGSRNVAELSETPDCLTSGGIADVLL